MEYHIREAKHSDMDQLCALFEELDRKHARAYPHVFNTASNAAARADYIRSILSQEDTSILVAERDGRLFGVVHAAVRDVPDFYMMLPRRFCWIGMISVSDECRRSGVGKALMESAQSWAAGKGASRCELNVWEFNEEALRFYEKLGFQTANRRMWRDLPAK